MQAKWSLARQRLNYETIVDSFLRALISADPTILFVVEPAFLGARLGGAIGESLFTLFASLTYAYHANKIITLNIERA